MECCGVVHVLEGDHGMVFSFLLVKMSDFRLEFDYGAWIN